MKKHICREIIIFLHYYSKIVKGYSFIGCENTNIYRVMKFSHSSNKKTHFTAQNNILFFNLKF